MEPAQHYDGLLDEETIRAILNLFETSSRDLVEDTLAALENGNRVQAMKGLHSLKGVALAVGAQRLGAEARRIEQVTAATPIDCAKLRAVYLETIEKVREFLGRSSLVP
ncbi:Hpt domain-containing protein [Novosphingobium sp. MMS21-SN21R]|uniref:Hpt domain-containing protein n=1 Tax=Novosphingobium sp. MMS21-SN21R TaxID=2969298 RepID=UPI0028871A4E|nr:Hpt domain-containing protein [Novosphingobium sp. MMS21-SN21R]MDT0506936.1 Hpt domain-containing protein [Novosphingobium sp. MMS21-SN21R]